MCATFSPDDLDKTVENANGDVIGTVAEIEGDTASIEPRSGVMDSIRAALGWERATEDTVLIHEDAIESISDDAIRLDSELEEPTSEASTDVEGSDRGPEPNEPAEPTLESDGRPIESGDEEPIEARDGTDEPDVIVDREPDRAEAAGGTESAEPTATRDRAGPADPVEETAGADELQSTDETGGADGLEETAEAHPAADTDDAETEFDDPVGADDRGGFEAPSAADETVDTNVRDGLEEPAATVDVADEREATDGIPSTEGDAETDDTAAGDAVSGETPDEGQSAPATDLADEFDGGVASDSFGEVSDGLDDADERNPTADADLADELDTETDIESIEAAGGSEAAANAAETADHDDTLADELDRGADIESVAESDDAAELEGSAGPNPADERDLTDELDRGPDIESVAAVDREAGADIDPDAIGGERSEAEDDAEMVDRRMVTEAGTEIDRRPAETAGERDRQALEDVETESEDGAASDGVTSDERSRSTAPLAAVVAAQRAALEPGKRAVEQGVALQGRLARNAVTSGVALQRQQLRLAGTVASAPFEIAAAMTGTGPSRDRRERSRAGTERAAEGADGEFDRTVALLERQLDRLEELHRDLTADSEAAQRRLELVDGLDAMYRERLVDAGIASLDDLARADSETVADAAEVTEKRAASWIEQVRP